MSTTNLIKGWEIETNTSGPDVRFLAPELRFVRLRGGVVENRGSIVHSGWIVAIYENGHVVETLSGSRYRLDGATDSDLAILRSSFKLLRDCPGEGYHPATLAHLRGVSLRD
ncbi:MAG: hypothetical protein AB7L09_01870 [Nitrospira sp.]